MAGGDERQRALARGLDAKASEADRLAERDRLLAGGEDPGETDRRSQAARGYAERWGLPAAAPNGARSLTKDLRMWR